MTNQFVHDVRVSVRALLKRPGFTAVAGRGARGAPSTASIPAIGTDRFVVANASRQSGRQPERLGIPAGAVAGLLLAARGVAALKDVAATILPRLSEVRFDASVFAFSLAVAGLTAVVFGLAPAAQILGVPLVSLLGSRGRHLAITRDGPARRSWLPKWRCL
jgi:hypothetical protein